MIIDPTIHVLLIVTMGMLGACFGSFAGVIIQRLPLEQSIVLPSSHCMSCKNKLKIWQKIPILSWLILCGKCFYCKKSIGVRLLVIELVFSVCLVALYVKFGLSFSLVERFIFIFILICLAYIDLDFFILPLSLIFSLLSLGVITTVVYYSAPDLYVAPTVTIPLFKFMVFHPHNLVLDRIWGALSGITFLSAINILMTAMLRKSGRLTKIQWAMGWGDPLLVMAIGLVVGLSHLLLVIFLASLIGTLIGVVSNYISNRTTPESDIAQGAVPYGPFLALAAIYVYSF